MLPFWSRFRHLAPFKAVLKGLNASAVGLIAAGCVTLYPKSVMSYADTMVFIVAGGLGAIYNFQAPFVIFWGCIFGAVQGCFEGIECLCCRIDCCRLCNLVPKISNDICRYDGFYCSGWAWSYL